ncbi:MAG: XRE family transcriptional regulator [Rhodobacteraceae bacterium]|nr:XRE family transcriptional regulator [Paracoccaceae bacterium]
MPDQNIVSEKGSKSLEVEVGSRIRKMRKMLGVTMSELAQSASISAGMLSRMENGYTSGSIATLHRIATALNIPIASFFEEVDTKWDATFVKSGHGLTMVRRGSSKGHIYELLGHKLRGDFSVEPYLITLNAGSSAHPIFQHEGVEFIFMLEGVVVYRHGTEVYELHPGDSLFFDSDAAHGPLELKELPAKFLSIMVTSNI